MGLQSPILFVTYDNVPVYGLSQTLYVCPSEKNIHFDVSEQLETTCLNNFFEKNQLPDTDDWHFFFSKKARDEYVNNHISDTNVGKKN